MKKIVSGLLMEGKQHLKYLKYKRSLPLNPMHDDIYIVEFPKSGITWLSNILGHIESEYTDKNNYVTFYNHHKYVVDIHQAQGVNINRTLKRTFIKSHAEFNPYYYFVVYLIRNPFDVMVSYFNFLKHSGYDNSFEFFIRDKKYGIKKWKNHVDSWFYKKIMAQRIHFMRYEDLMSEPIKTIENLYKNLGVHISDEVIKKAVQKSDLKIMSGSEEHYKLYNYNYTMSFVGKKNKEKKSELLNEEAKSFILKETKEHLSFLYPELL
jgi:hypothetical protein